MRALDEMLWRALTVGDDPVDVVDEEEADDA